jgi:hypothetical protein
MPHLWSPVKNAYGDDFYSGNSQPVKPPAVYGNGMAPPCRLHDVWSTLPLASQEPFGYHE